MMNKMPAIPVQRHHEHAEFGEYGRIRARLSGEMVQLLAQSLAPGREEVRGVLVRLRTRLGCSRALLAAVLGVDTATLRRWEDGRRNPSAATRRLIWLCDGLLVSPGKLRDVESLLTWSRQPGGATP